ncbi:MAG: amidohydrolase [Gemmatimonadetes bacterium]|nr:amidohydrolase [Gemmatimonadota bacterium]
MRSSAALAAAVLPLLAATALAAQQPVRTTAITTERLKQEVLQEVAGLQQLSQQITDMVFSFAELGFQEHRTAAYLTGILRREGFTVETGCAGLPTCYVARWGSGPPVIGFMGDIDGLPATSLMPGVPWQEPPIAGGPGHGEGLNSTPAVDLVAAIATRRVLARHHLPGEIRVIPGVAEELVASRVYMVNAGLFGGMDAMLSTHVDSELRTAWGVSGSGLISTVFTFSGQSAHSAGAPWAGRSALDAVELMNIGWNYRREHLRLQQRSHYVIPNGGSQPNVVPSEASVWYYFRELDYPHIRELHELGQTIARAAAQMTGTSVTERPLGAAWPQTYNRPMAEAMHANILAVGMPPWTEADQAFAKAVQAMAGQKEPQGLRTEVAKELQQAEQGMGGGSDDVAEVSWNIPTVRLRYAANIPGLTGHHWSSAIAMATPIAHLGANYGARVIAMTAIDLLTDPALLARARQYFADVSTKDFQWVSLIPPETRPPVELNRDRMAAYAAALDRLVYDPKRYASYLDQLGVKYPTLRKE